MANGMITETLTESRLREVAPSGFQTTFTDAGRLRQLSNQDVNLSDTVDEYDGNKLTEKQIIEYEIERAVTSFLTEERTMELPGLGLLHRGGFSAIHAFASMFKESDDTPTGTIKGPRRATSDDLVFMFAGPEVYGEVAGQSIDNFKTSGHTAGDVVHVVGEDGYGGTTDGTLSLDDDERLIYTGDYIDVSPGKSIFNRHEWVNVDGESNDYGPQSFLFENRLSGANLGLGTGAHIKREAQLDFVAYEDGDAELVPVAFWMAPGHKVPSL